MLVGRGEEFFNGEIWLKVRGKENVRNVICGYKFCNTLRVRRPLSLDVSLLTHVTKEQESLFVPPI